MNDLIANAIEQSGPWLQLRSKEDQTSWQAPLSVPQGVADFFRQVKGGILFPIISKNGTEEPHGFEVLDSTLFDSINDLLGGPSGSSPEADVFDRCHVLFSTVADQCLLFGVDLGEKHFGWIFMVDLNPGNNPADTAEYVAHSFEAWMDQLLFACTQQADRKQRDASDPPKLGKVALSEV